MGKVILHIHCFGVPLRTMACSGSMSCIHKLTDLHDVPIGRAAKNGTSSGLSVEAYGTGARLLAKIAISRMSSVCVVTQNTDATARAQQKCNLMSLVLTLN